MLVVSSPKENSLISRFAGSKFKCIFNLVNTAKSPFKKVSQICFPIKSLSRCLLIHNSIIIICACVNLFQSDEYFVCKQLISNEEDNIFIYLLAV